MPDQPNVPRAPAHDTHNQPMAMNTHDTLLAYSEWLDSEGLVKSDTGTDKRTHDELAREFLEQWESTHTRATLAGREPVTRQAAAALPWFVPRPPVGPSAAGGPMGVG